MHWLTIDDLISIALLFTAERLLICLITVESEYNSICHTILVPNLRAYFVFAKWFLFVERFLFVKTDAYSAHLTSPVISWAHKMFCENVMVILMSLWRHMRDWPWRAWWITRWPLLSVIWCSARKSWITSLLESQHFCWQRCFFCRIPHHLILPI